MLVRLCYASTRLDHQNLLQDLSDISTSLVNYNIKNNICGVLYYAQNSFFQCLEGEEAVVLDLFEIIKKDIRYDQVLKLSLCNIQKQKFHEWSMNYVTSQHEVDCFFKARGYTFFSPTILKSEEVSDLVELLLKKARERLSHVHQTHRGYKRGYCNYIDC